MRTINHEIRVEALDICDKDHVLTMNFRAFDTRQTLENFISLLETGIANNMMYQGYSIIFTTTIRDEVEENDEK